MDATPLLALYARWRAWQLRNQDAVEAQRRQFHNLIRKAAATRFGRDHEFASLGTPADFAKAVPLRKWDDFWRDYWSKSYPRLTDISWPGTIPYFAVSSGTSTGATKVIPVSREMVSGNTRAAFDLYTHHLANRPRSRIWGGKSFMLGGSTDLVEEAPGIRKGDLSGIAAVRVPRWAQRFTYPPRALAIDPDWERKTQRLAEDAIHQDIRTLAGTPSWVLLFLDRMMQMQPRRARRLSAFWPNLELIVHGGVDFRPYKRLFDDLMAGGHSELREVYPASEGFVAVADRGFGEGLRLMADNGIFFEFVPVEEAGSTNPTRHWLGTVQPGIDYAIVLSTCAGLWAYQLGDVVRFVSTDPPRLLVSGRTSYFLSAFGEHLSGEQVETAIDAAAEAIGEAILDYSAGAEFPELAGMPGRHVFVVEFASGLTEPEALARFAARLDQALAENFEYQEKRSGDYALRAPHVVSVEKGTFAGWMKRRGKLGGQNKVPRVIADQSLLRDLLSFAREGAAVEA